MAKRHFASARKSSPVSHYSYEDTFPVPITPDTVKLAFEAIEAGYKGAKGLIEYLHEHPLSFSILDSKLENDIHDITVEVTNRTSDAIYLESMIAGPPDPKNPHNELFLGTDTFNANFTFGDGLSFGGGDSHKAINPVRVAPQAKVPFHIRIPHLNEKAHTKKPFGIVECEFSRLGAKKPDKEKFVFRVRWK